LFYIDLNQYYYIFKIFGKLKRSLKSFDMIFFFFIQYPSQTKKKYDHCESL